MMAWKEKDPFVPNNAFDIFVYAPIGLDVLCLSATKRQVLLGSLCTTIVLPVSLCTPSQ